MFDQFSILRNIEQVKLRFDLGDARFTMGIGKPLLRNALSAKFIQLGGRFTSTISTKATIGKYGVSIGEGSNILDGAKISNSVVIGKGAIVYYNAIITHDCVIGDFVEISPGATLLGRVEVGDFCQVGVAP